MKVLELFCGHGSWSKPWVEANHDVTGIDLLDFSETYPGKFIQADLFDWDTTENYDIVLASPPCSEFSEVKRNTAQRYDERQGLDLVYRTFYLISKIKPKYWVLENVWGLAEFIDKPKDIVRYRRAKNGKRAYLWGNFSPLGFFEQDIKYYPENWHFKNGWSKENRAMRAIIPEALTKAMFRSMNEPS